ncbi:MAG: peptide MFS transporter [Cyclobacteriaceae bacterium]|nr:peptide MFS transporter [Cyclobacteriaceae bacterium]
MSSSKTFFGHPRGLATLFFTEMWERFSYYGMRALLLLFMLASVEEGGMGIDVKTGGAIYGLYTMFVYLLALPGGWLADKFFGLRKSVFYGGCLITAGHFCLAFPFTETFFIGLLLIVMGTGLLKPNISSLVGELYSSSEQARRDSGFSIFYLGINIGATLAPIITSYLGETINWHYGFAAAGIGMLLGVIQYKLTEKNLGLAGLEPNKLADPILQSKREKNFIVGLLIFAVLLISFIALLLTRVITINPVTIATASVYAIGGSVVLYFGYILLFEKLDKSEKNKIKAIAIFFLASAMFYFGYEQQGSSLTIFADRYTDRFIGSFEFPAGWFQVVPAASVVIFVPLFAWLWVWLSKRNLNPSTPKKLSLGLIFMGLGYAVMMGGSMIIVSGSKALPTWLIFTYIFHTFGEICLYPIGLSAVSKLSPKRLVGQMMGVWFMSLALGNLVAGLFSGEFDETSITTNPQLLVDLFQGVVSVMIVSGIIIWLFNKPLKKLMGDIH